MRLGKLSYNRTGSAYSQKREQHTGQELTQLIFLMFLVSLRPIRRQQYLWSDFSDMANITGDPGANILVGTIETDVILGLDGDDTINGLEGDDNINGNRGNDVIFGNDGNDIVQGGKNNDIIFGLDENDTLFGDLDNDELHGNTGDDFLFGDDGNDTLRGGRNSDNLFGGNDNDWLFGEIGDDFLNGNAGNDRLDGGDGSDTLRGGRGDDNLLGGSDSDFLFGDLGSDTLTGGSGSDFFILQASTEGFDVSGADLITDYNDSEDFLVLGGDLSFDDLAFSRSNQIGADNSLVESAVISLASNNKVIAILQNVAVSVLTESDFLSSSGEPVSGTSSGSTDTNTDTDTDTDTNTNSEDNLSNADDLDTLTGTSSEGGSLDNDDPADIYRFGIPAASSFSAILSGLSDDADADLELIRDANGNGIIDSGEIIESSSELGNVQETITVDNLVAGTYFVRVLQVEGETDYTLRLTGTEI